MSKNSEMREIMSFFFYSTEDRLEQTELNDASLFLFHEEGSFVFGKPRALSYVFSFEKETRESLDVLKDALLALGAEKIAIESSSLVFCGKRISRDRYFEKDGRFFHSGTMFYSRKTPQLLPMEEVQSGLTMLLLVGAIKYQFEKRFGKSADEESCAM